MRELLDRFSEWDEFSRTHANRHLNIIDRHVANAKKWVDIVREYPVNSPEFAANMLLLHNELCGLYDEFREVYADMGGDAARLCGVIELLAKELKKVSNGIPRHRIKKAN